MAKTYFGLVWWQWAVVVVLAVHESLAVTTSAGNFAGALLGTTIVLYIVARLITLGTRNLRSRVRNRKQAAQS